MAKIFSIDGKSITATENGTRWTVAPDQFEKHKLDPTWMVDLKAAPKATTDALAAVETAAAVVVAPLV